jgi:hypothetical protein
MESRDVIHSSQDRRDLSFQLSVGPRKTQSKRHNKIKKA